MKLCLVMTLKNALFILNNNLFYLINNCRGWVWILSPKGRKIQAQRAQYNEFVESELKD